jgi:DNA-binding response OmpR family regulator
MTNVRQAPGASDVVVGRSILIIEDNETLALGLRTSLEVEGYNVECVTDGNDGLLARATQSRSDHSRSDAARPERVELLTSGPWWSGGGADSFARDQEVDSVGFRIGADDYVVKPVGVLELLARVEAIIRRAGAAGKGSAGSGESARVSQLRFSDVIVDLRTRTVLRGGEPVELSPMEFDFLSFLIESGGDIVSRDTLMRQVWRYSFGVTSRTVDQHVARLRNKLEPDPAQPRHLITVRKAGYRFQR